MKNIILKAIEKLGYKIEKRVDKPSHVEIQDQILKKLIENPAPIILDVGGHKGESVIHFRDCLPGSIIHSFEPEPDSFKVLQENTSGLENIYLNNLGITNDQSIGPATFFRHSHSKLNSLNKINIEGKIIQESLKVQENTAEDHNREIQVNLTSINSYCKENNITSVDLLKMDTQGHEKQCLEGSSDILDNVKVIYTEINFFDMYEVKYNFFDLEKILVPHGFSLYALPRINTEKGSNKISWVEAVYVNERFFPNA